MSKLCVDCKHCHVGLSGAKFAKCKRPLGKDHIDRVTGETKTLRFEYCSIQREDPWWCLFAYGFGFCMQQGRFWEPRDQATLQRPQRGEGE